MSFYTKKCRGCDNAVFIDGTNRLICTSVSATKQYIQEYGEDNKAQNDFDCRQYVKREGNDF